MLFVFVPSPLFRSKMCSILGRIIHGIGIEMRKSGKKTNMDFMSYNHYKYVSNGCPNQLQLKFLIEISLTFEVKRRYIQVDGFSQQVPEKRNSKNISKIQNTKKSLNGVYILGVQISSI